METFNFFILAGGKSTRMGSPKHLLPLADGQPLYSRLAQVLRAASPELSTLYISFAVHSVLDDTIRRGELPVETVEGLSQLQLCNILDDAEREIGPAAGLITAHHHDRNATWLVVACDFPLLRAETVQQLMDEYEGPVTCFRNAEGFSEPFLAVWSPRALQALEKNVARGILGPNHTIKELSGKRITPRCEWWIKNVNTCEEWESAKKHMDASHTSSFME